MGVGTGATATNWDNTANWQRTAGTTGNFPNAVGDIAQFTGTTGGTTATVDIPVTVAEIDFGSTLSYTINNTGTNAITLQATSGNTILSTTSAQGTGVVDNIAAPLSVNAGTPLAATLAKGTLKLSNISSTTPNTVTGTFTVSAGATLEALNTQTAGTDALGTATVALAGGTFKPDPVPSFQAAAPGAFGRYYNLGFTAANNPNNTAGPAVGQVDFSQTPTTTRADTGGINFASANPPAWQPSGINTTNFAAEWTAGLNIMTGGSYTFQVVSDDGAQLFIDGTALVTNNQNATGTSSAVFLNAGSHSVEMRYFQATGGAGNVLNYNGPDSSNTNVVIPATSVATSSGLFQINTATANTFTNPITLSATSTIDMTAAAMDATLGAMTTTAAATLNVTGSFTGRSLNLGGTTLGANLTVSPSGVNVNPGAITGGGFSLTKTGVGPLTLSQAGTNLAGTTVTAGTLVLSNASALGAGPLNISAAGTVITTADNLLTGVTVNVGAGGVLQAQSANALAGATVNLNGGALVLRADAATTFAVGTLTIASNTSTINVNRLTSAGGSGIALSLTTTNPLAFSGGANRINVTGGNTYSLQLTGAYTLTQNLTVNTVDANFTFGGALTGAFTITKIGTGTVTFSVDSTAWTGSGGNTLFIQQGTANVATANGAGLAASTVTLQGGSLGLSGSTITYTMNVVLDGTLGTGTINNPNNVTNTISGTWTIAPGQQLQTTGTGTVALSQGLTTSTGFYVFNTNGASLTLSGVISGPGTLVKLGGSTLTLTNQNTYSGGSVINAGSLQGNNSATGPVTTSLGSGQITLNGGQLNLRGDTGASLTFANSIVVNANATINVDRSGTTSGTLVVSGSLTLGNNTLTITSNGNTENVSFAGATLKGSATLNLTNASSSAGTITFGVIDDQGNGFGITKTGTNTLVLSAANTYTGDTHVNAGTLQMLSTASLATPGAGTNNVFVEPGATLQLNAATNIGGSTTLNIASSPTTLGALDLRYTGALPAVSGSSSGLLALGTGGTYAQAINLATLGNGTFVLGASVNTTLTGTLTPGGTVYRLGGGGAQLAIGGTNVLADNGGPTQLVVGTSLPNGTGNVQTSLGSAIATLSYSGTVVLLNSNTYTGGTVVNRGMSLVVGTGGNLAGTGGTPLGTGAVNVFGSLIAAGVNGSFLNNDTTGNNNQNAIAFNPGSTLLFDSNTAYQGLAAGNHVNNNRWGDTTPIALNGSALKIIGLNNNTASAETVGAVTFDKGSSVALTHTGTGKATLTVAGLARATGTNGTLAIVPSAASQLGVNELLIDSNAATDLTPITTGVNLTETNVSSMLPGYFVNATENTFVFHQSAAVGFTNTKFSTNTLNTAVAANKDVIDVNTAALTLATNPTVFALRTNQNISSSGTFTTITFAAGTGAVGGLLTTANATDTATLAFGSNEAIVYVANGVTLTQGGTTTGAITGTGGLTFFSNTSGTGHLNVPSTLTGGNAFTGGVNVQSGGIVARQAAAYGTNQITLNGSGATWFLRADVATTYNNDVVVNGDSTIDTNRDASGSATGINTTIGNLTIGNWTLSIVAGNTYLVTVGGTTTLTGNATLNTNSANNTTTLTNGLSDGGGGFGLTKTGNNNLTVNGTGTSTGQTNAFGASVTLAAGLVIGNAAVAPGATLNLAALTNLNAGAKVTVTSNNLGLGALGIGFNAAQTDLTGIITGGSSGVLGVNTTISNALNLSTIGLGTFFLGSTTGGTYSGATLGIGAGNVWRLGGGGNTLTVANSVIIDVGGPTPVQVGAALANGTGSLVNGGGTVNFAVAQGYTGSTTLAGTTLGLLTGSANNDATTVISRTLTGDLILQGNSTLNVGPSGQTYSSIIVTLNGKINYGGNTFTVGQGVLKLAGGAAVGTGITVITNGALLHVTHTNFDQLSSGNLQLNNGVFLLGKDDGTGVAPSWTQFMARYAGGFGAGPNQWQITGGGAGFAAKGGQATILVNNTNAAYGYVNSLTLFDQSYRLGSDRRGDQPGVAGSQVYYADAPVVIAQNTVLSGVRIITAAPTGPGVSGAAGSGVVYRITGNLGGFGALQFNTFDAPEGTGVAGASFDAVAEIVLAGTDNWTGTPGTVQNLNPGQGGIVLNQNTLIRFASPASLPTGNGGLPAFLAAIRDNTNSYAGGFLLTAGSTYTLPAGYSFAFGESIVGSGNTRTSILGATSDNGTPGTVTLQNVNVLILNTTPAPATSLPLPVDLAVSGSQPIGIVVRDGTLNLSSVTFQAANEVYLANNNAGGTVLEGNAHPLALGYADTQPAVATVALRTIEKVGAGTAVVTSVAYSLPLSGTAVGVNFTWNVGNSTTSGNTLQLGASGQLTGTVNVFSGTLDLNNFNQTVTALTLGGGVAGSTSTVTTGTGTLTLAGNVTYNGNTNNAGMATINGNLNLGGATRTFTVNDSTAVNPDVLINAVVSNGGLSKAGAGQLQLTATTNSYTGGTTVSAGTLIVTFNNELSTGTITLSGGTLALHSDTALNITNNVSVTASSTIDVNNLTTAMGLTHMLNTLSIGNVTLTVTGGNGFALTFGGNVTLTANTPTFAPTTANLTLAGVVSGAVALTKAGANTSTLTLSGTNTFTGGVTVSNGQLTITNSSALGAGTKTVTVANGTAGNSNLHLSPSAGSITLASTITLSTSNVAGTIFNDAGNNTINGPISLTSGGGGTYVVVNAGSLTLAGAISIATGVTGLRPLILGGAGTGSVTNVIADGGGTLNLVKQDAGTWTVSGNNTFTGGTAVTGGTLLVTNTAGSGTGTGAVTVGTGATLAGTGTVSGAVTVSGGTVRPGTTGVGVLTVGAADFSGGTLLIRLPAYGTPGTNYSQLNVTGTGTALTLGGTSNLTLDLSGLSTTGTANNIAVTTSGTVSGTFATLTRINNPNFFAASASYTATAVSVTVFTPPPIALHFKFNYPGNTPPPGYTSVLPTTTYTVAQGYGWQSTTGLFAQDRGGPTPLLRDLIAGQDNIFLIDLPSPGDYAITLTGGDRNYLHDQIDVLVGGVSQLGGHLIFEPAGQFVTTTFTVSVVGTQLALEIKDRGGEPFWAINALDVRSASLVGAITLTASPPTITADGVSTSTISGTSSLPQGALVTVSTSLGTITTADADPNYAGIQVVVGAGGSFSFVVQAPFAGSQAAITATEVTGAAAGSTTLAFTPPAALHFEFNAPGSPTQSGYAPVSATATYAAGQGYGWLTPPVGTFDRGGPTTLLRSGQYGSDNTFRVDLPNGTYTVNLTLGDAANPHDLIDVLVNGTSVLGGRLISTSPGQFVTRSFSVGVTGGNLQVEIKDQGGEPFWVLNALDVQSAPGTITLMSSTPTLMADGTSTATISGSGARPNSLVTVSTSLGTITTADADPNYAGVQVMADGSGNFSFVVRAPNAGGGTPLLTANDVTGAAGGSSATILTIIPPNTSHFQFVYQYNPQQQAGYQIVFPTDTYSASTGYGWATLGTNGQFRTSNPFRGTAGRENLQRGLQYGQDDTFQVLVHVTGIDHFTVTLYLGDNDKPHNQHIFLGGSAGTIDEGTAPTGVDNPSMPQGGFVILTFQVPAADFNPDANGNDILLIHLVGIGTLTDPGDNNFSANGVDVVGSTTPGPMGGVNGQGTTVAPAPTGATLGAAAPAPVLVSAVPLTNSGSGDGVTAAGPAPAAPVLTATPSVSAPVLPKVGVPATQLDLVLSLATVLDGLGVDAATVPLAAGSAPDLTAGWHLLSQAVRSSARAETGAPAGPGEGPKSGHPSEVGMGNRTYSLSETLASNPSSPDHRPVARNSAGVGGRRQSPPEDLDQLFADLV